MNISEFSVKNWQFMLVMFLGVVALGINSLVNMPRSEDPDMTTRSVAVIFVYPGTDAVDMEELIVDKAESRFNELDNVKEIITYIGDGVASVRIEFEWNESSSDDNYQATVREVNALQKELPQDIYRIDIQRFTPTDVSVMQAALVSDVVSNRELGQQAERLRKLLEKVPALKKAKDWGYPNTNIRVALNIEKMAQVNIPANRILGALQSENLVIPAGSLSLGSRKFNVKTTEKYKSLEEIGNTIVGTNGTKIVYLKDIAEVGYNYEEETYLTRLNGHRCALVTVAQKEGKNISKTGAIINPIIESFEKTLPSNIKLVKNFDQSVSVTKRLNNFAKDFAIAILLVSLTLLPLGFRAAIVVMVSIPLSLAIGLAAIDFLGFSINQLSVVGLIVALGILVDDSIVVVENIERWMRDGYNKREAAIKATKQITLAVIGCTVTLILAFLPLNFLPESSGQFIRSLPIAVTMTILASMIVSLTIVPFLSSRILKHDHNPNGNIFMRALKKLISGSYSKLLHWALRHPWPTLAVAVLLFGLSLQIPKRIGFALFPKSEKPMFLITAETPDGSALSETNRVAKLIEAKLKQTKEIKYYTTNVGRGNPRIYYNIIQRNETANYAEFFVQANDITPAQKTVLIDQLRSQFSGVANAVIQVKDFEQGPPVEAPIAIRIYGEDLEKQRKIANDVQKILQETEGTVYVNNPLAYRKTDIRVKINKEKAGLLGIAIADINRTVRLAIAGLNIGTFRDTNGDDYNINVTLPKGNTTTLESLNSLYINTMMGGAVPLRQIADIQFETSANQIRHYNLDRLVTLTANLKTGYQIDKVYNEVIAKLDKYPMPEGFKYKAAGELEARQKSFGGLGTIILLTIFGFIGVLILEFGTFKSSLIVLSVIPLGVIGAFSALYLVGYPLSFVAIVGLIALVGIEVKNSILLVDFTNQLRQDGMPLIEAIEQAGEIRFVPIVLTSLTAIGGLIPLAIEANPLYSPLAWVLIGGLISSTILSRILTPVMYKLMPPKIS